MRPWRAPLPRPRPAAISVLGDYFPIQLQSNLERSKEDWSGKGNQPLILGHDELVLRAKSFGRPTLNLEAHKSDRVNQRRRRTGLFISSSKPQAVAATRQFANSCPRQTLLRCHGSKATPGRDTGATSTTGSCRRRTDRRATTTTRACRRWTCGRTTTKRNCGWRTELCWRKPHREKQSTKV
jgi:hypothetical protein